MEDFETSNVDGRTEGSEEEPRADELDALRRQLAGRAAANAAALARLREALIASDPAIDPAMVAGDSLEEIEGSFAAARAMAERIREAVRREQATGIPAGSGGRAGALPATPFEKIRSGLGGR